MPKYKRICPKCKSTDIKTDFSDPGIVATGMFMNQFICKKCGFSGAFFPEVEK